jgi:hypothetical protein
MTMRDGLPPPTGRHFLYDVPPGRTAADSQPEVSQIRETSTFSAHQPGWRVGVVDAAAEQRLADAYRESDERDANAWKTPSQDAAQLPAGRYPLSSGEGSQCTINGQPGHLKRQGDWLICQPDGKTDAMPTRDASLTLDDALRRLEDVRRAAIAERDALDANAWRNPT